MIRLYKGFKYDNKYDYVKGFLNEIDRKNWFISQPHLDVLDTNYIRNNDTIIVPYNLEEIRELGVNYISYNNGYRDIYNFIVKKEYVNNNATRLQLEVDVFQTYMFDFDFMNSFVERKNCTIGEITDFDEGLSIGEHSIVSEITAFNKGEVYFAMFSGIKNYEVTTNAEGKIIHYAEIPSSNSKPLTKINGVNYPLFFMPLPSGNIPVELSDHPSLVGVVRFPNCTYTTQQIKIPFLLRMTDQTGGGKPPWYETVDRLVDVAVNITATSNSGNGGSVAKTEVTDFYPYTYYVLTDGEGEPVVMKPQDLPSAIDVIGKYALSHQPVERFYVEGYKGDTTGRVYNITNTNQMMLPTGSSEGMAYIAANGGSLEMKRNNQVIDNVLGIGTTIGSAIATGGMSLMFGGIQSGVSGINQVREADQRTQDIMLTPNSIKSYGTPSTRNSFLTNNVRVLKYTVSDKVKNKIRNYTSRFGNKFNNYAIIDHKSYKGYVKIISPDIDSKIDNEAINKLINIFERGVYIE